MIYAPKQENSSSPTLTLLRSETRSIHAIIGAEQRVAHAKITQPTFCELGKST
jgi:hypothetical protein